MFERLFGKKSPSTKELDWPFSSSKNEAVVTVQQIIVKEKPILVVKRDVEDGGWQFLTGDLVSTADVKIVGLEEIAELDPTILRLADLKLGWHATRLDTASSWVRAKSSLA